MPSSPPPAIPLPLKGACRCGRVEIEVTRPPLATSACQLKAASGKDFEAKYITLQADAHRKAVALFAAYANSGDDPALKEFAKATLPTLEMHEKEVKELQAAHG